MAFPNFSTSKVGVSCKSSHQSSVHVADPRWFSGHEVQGSPDREEDDKHAEDWPNWDPWSEGNFLAIPLWFFHIAMSNHHS